MPSNNKCKNWKYVFTPNIISLQVYIKVLTTFTCEHFAVLFRFDRDIQFIIRLIEKSLLVLSAWLDLCGFDSVVDFTQSGSGVCVRGRGCTTCVTALCTWHLSVWITSVISIQEHLCIQAALPVATGGHIMAYLCMIQFWFH